MKVRGFFYGRNSGRLPGSYLLADGRTFDTCREAFASSVTTTGPLNYLLKIFLESRWVTQQRP
jgi:hypothetical protein